MPLYPVIPNSYHQIREKGREVSVPTCKERQRSVKYTSKKSSFCLCKGNEGQCTGNKSHGGLLGRCGTRKLGRRSRGNLGNRRLAVARRGGSGRSGRSGSVFAGNYSGRRWVGGGDDRGDDSSRVGHGGVSRNVRGRRNDSRVDWGWRRSARGLVTRNRVCDDSGVSRNRGGNDDSAVARSRRGDNSGSRDGNSLSSRVTGGDVRDRGIVRRVRRGNHAVRRRCRRCRMVVG